MQYWGYFYSCRSSSIIISKHLNFFPAHKYVKYIRYDYFISTFVDLFRKYSLNLTFSTIFHFFDKLHIFLKTFVGVKKIFFVCEQVKKINSHRNFCLFGTSFKDTIFYWILLKTRFILSLWTCVFDLQRFLFIIIKLI